MSDETNNVSARGRWTCFAVIIAVSAFVFWTYHDRFWYPPDEGNYAHVAQRVLAGEVLNRDVQDVHAGYINFANAAWMGIFGESLLSLRYPLIFIGVFAAGMSFWLTSARSLSTGVAAGLVVVTLSIVQFLNPTAHWYCFALKWGIVGCLTWWPRESRGRLLTVGFLIGLMFLFRQLTGVLVAMGVLTWLLQERGRVGGDEDDRVGTWFARGLLGVMFLGLLSYLGRRTEGLTLALYGAWPLALLVIVGWRVHVSMKSLLQMLALLGAGAIVSASPVLMYHWQHGSLSSWLDDTVFSAQALTHLDFFRQISFPEILSAAWSALQSPDGIGDAVNALFWIAALCAAPILGFCTLRSAVQSQSPTDSCSPLIVMAVFYGVVSLHYQIPIYLFYTLSLTIVALLEVGSDQGRLRAAAVTGSMALVIIGLHCHAAQPLSRGWTGILRGTRHFEYVSSSNGRCGLHVASESEAVYTEICDLIDEQCARDETILALPSNAEIYFLSGRENPFRFFNTALGLRTDRDAREAVALLESAPPRLVFHHPEDKYNTDQSRILINWVRARYRKLPSIGHFDVYVRAAESPVLADASAT